MLPAQSRHRLRLPVFLLTALLLNVLAISALTIPALRGQQADIERSRQTTWERALGLLGSEVEHELLKAIQSPFLLLKNLNQESISDARLTLLMNSFPDVEQALFFTTDVALERSHPRLATRRDRLTADWIAERTRQELLSTTGQRLLIHSFVEELDGKPTLFAFQSVNDLPDDTSMASPAGWVVLKIDLGSLTARHIAKMLNKFSRDSGAKVRLVGPGDSGRGVSVSLNRVLPGWMLLADNGFPAPKPAGFDRHEVASVTLGIGALVSVILTMVAIWWEIRREYALVDIRNRFITSVSHELKTPLSLIRMYAETLYLKRQNDPALQREYIGVMLREAERLSAMINDVLTFSKLRAGGAVYHLTATDIGATVADIVEHYREHFAARRLRIALTMAEPLPPVAHDPNGITQILLNLFDNVAKYAADGGMLEVYLRADDRWVDLDVIDYGPGIDHEKRMRLTRAFRRGELSDIATGSGLGLALVEHIAEAHGGHLIIEDAEGHRGLKVSISFPGYVERL